MGTKILIGVIAALFVAFGMMSEQANAQDPANYHWESTGHNFYTHNTLIYHFTGLDVAEDYTWLLQSLNTDGTPGFAMGQRRIGGATTHTVTWTANDFVTNDGLTYDGAARVIDSYGNILGRHYIKRSGGITDDWFSNAGQNPVDDRVGVGSTLNTVEKTSAGWIHPEDIPGIVMTQRGTNTFLHYCFDSALFPTTDEYRFFDMDSTLVLTVGIQELWNYQDDNGRVTLGDTNEHCSFVVMTTSGVFPAFIDIEENNSSWPGVAQHDNPHYATFTAGAYSYYRTDSAGTWRADGESVFLVTTGGKTEWSVSTSAVDKTGSSNRVEFISKTEEIWIDEFSNHEFFDSELGLVDSTDYDYIPVRNYDYTTGVAIGEHTLDWYIYPQLEVWNAATASERGFVVSTSHILAFDFTTSQTIENELEGLGFGTDLGRGLVMLLIMVVAMIAASKFGARGFLPYAMIFIIIGGGWIAISLSDPVTTVIYAIVAVIFLWLAISKNMDSSSSSQGDF